MRVVTAALLASVSLPALAQEQPKVDINQYAVPAINPNAGPPSGPIMAHPTGSPFIAGALAAQTEGPPIRTQPITQEPSTRQAQPPTSDPKVPASMPPTIPALSPNKTLRPVERKAVGSALAWMSHAVAPTMQADGRAHFNGNIGEPFIVCAPLHVCDIALPPGEVVNPPVENGDPRWIVNPGISGGGYQRVTHLFIKPTDAGLNSNLIVSTNKRVISMRLVSRTGDYMPLIAIDDEPSVAQNAAWSAYKSAVSGGSGGFSAGDTPCDQSPSTPPSSFKIERNNVSWRPVQVYAVSTTYGTKTCIQFPASIDSADLPALLLLGNDGGWFTGPSEQIVQYRYVKGRFELDRLVDRAVLVAGVGRSQERVEITRRQP